MMTLRNIRQRGVRSPAITLPCDGLQSSSAQADVR